MTRSSVATLQRFALNAMGRALELRVIAAPVERRRGPCCTARSALTPRRADQQFVRFERVVLQDVRAFVHRMATARASAGLA